MRGNFQSNHVPSRRDAYLCYVRRRYRGERVGRDGQKRRSVFAGRRATDIRLNGGGEGMENGVMPTGSYTLIRPARVSTRRYHTLAPWGRATREYIM